MAQLKEDEWPTDGEPTTSEQEGDQFKREGTKSPVERSHDLSREINRTRQEIEREPGTGRRRPAPGT